MPRTALPVLPVAFLRLAGAGVALAGAALLSSCGGGTAQADPYRPAHLLAFGDEMSALTGAGHKYSINGLASDGTTFDCTVNPIWVQYLASAYGMHFAQCPGTATTAATAVSYAAPGAGVAEVTAQIDAAAASVVADDLATVLVGVNDVKRLFVDRGTADDAALIQSSRDLGLKLATQLNRLVGLGAKVIYSTMPDVGLTPWGLAQGTAGAALLTKMASAYNEAARTNMVNAGTYIGLVLGDEFVQTAVRFPGVYGMASTTAVTVAACTVALPDCTKTTVGSGVLPDAWLWADALWPASLAHRQLGMSAVSRTQTNQF